MADFSIAVVVVDLRQDPNYMRYVNPMTSEKPFMAFVAANPSLRAEGRTEADALDRLKEYILGLIPKGKRKIVDLQFGELVVEGIMGS